MTGADWSRIKELFHAAVGLPEADREAFLQREAAGDPRLYAEVRSLLAADTQDNGLSAPFAPPLRESVSIGQTLNHYRILDRLGSGGMGEVFVALDTKLARKVALKVLPSNVALDADRRRRFEGEARTIAALQHPNIVTVYSIEEDAGLPFITMELVEGSPLAAIIPSGGFSRERLMALSQAIADAVSAAHEHGIVHRDLKPANVMVTPGDGIKVLDFGLAKLNTREESPTPADGEAASPRSGNSLLWGTVSYMSPEQVEGKRADERSDVFSLGIMFYEMATGQRPFRGTSSASILSSIVNDAPAPVETVNAAIPSAFSRIVTRALEKDPERRFQTAAQLRQELAAIRRRRASMLTMTAAAAVLAAIVAIAAAAWPSGSRTAVPFEHFQISRITTTGTVSQAHVSRDGQIVVQVVADGGQQSLWVHQATATAAVQIVPPANVLYVGATVSPDGRDVYFATYPKDANVATLYKLPIDGRGAPAKILDDIDTGVVFSPDAKQFAFVRGFTDASAVMVGNIDGTGITVVAKRTLPRSFALTSPAWHPGGQSLAVAAWDDREAGRSKIVELAIADGREHVIAEQNWTGVRGLAWSSDGLGLVVSAVQLAGATPSGQLWYVSSATGSARRITNDLTDYGPISVTADSRRIVTVQAEAESHLWIADPDGGQSTQVTSGARSADGFGGVAWTPDGRLVYVSRRGDSSEIVVTEQDGSRRQSLVTDGRVKSDPVVMPGGKYVLFTSRDGSTSHIYRTEMNGGRVIQLTQGDGELSPIASVDGKSLYFATRDPDRFFAGITWRVAVDGGERVRVTEKGLQPLALSPDGKILAGNIWDESTKRVRLATLSIDGTDSVRTFPLGPRTVAWTPDGRLTYVENARGVGNVWELPLDGTPARQLTHFSSERIIAFAWSPDGRKLAAARGRTVLDAVMITDAGAGR